jgi:hypothetical protein
VVASRTCTPCAWIAVVGGVFGASRGFAAVGVSPECHREVPAWRDYGAQQWDSRGLEGLGSDPGQCCALWLRVYCPRTFVDAGDAT